MKIIKTKNVRPFLKFKKLQHIRSGRIVAQFEYSNYGQGSWWGMYSDLEINLYIESLKIRIRTFEEKKWPTIQEKVALLKFKELGLE